MLQSNITHKLIYCHTVYNCKYWNATHRGVVEKTGTLTCTINMECYAAMKIDKKDLYEVI